jgi:Tfp pilus assembly protein PilN
VVYLNLLPSKVRKTKVALRLYTYIIIASSLAVIVMVLLLLNLLAQTKRIDAKITEFKKAEQALADKIGPLLGLAEEEQKMNALKSLVRKLTPEQSVWIKILDEIASLVQDDMWLMQILSERKENDQRLELTLEGEAYNKISVADFLTMLENSGLFTNVSLEALSETQVDQRTQVQFKLKMIYAGVLAHFAGETDK